MTNDPKHSESDVNLFNIVKDNILPLYNLQHASIEQIKVKNTEKQRAVYKITYNNISYCLKKVYYDEDNLLFVYSAMEWWYLNNINLPKLLPTINKNRFVKYNNMIFILTPWVSGVKCDFDNTDNILKSASNLANMHKCSYNFYPIEGSNQKQGYDNIYITITNHFHKILTCYNEAVQKRKDTYSKLFLSCFEANSSLAKFSSDIASSINFDNLTKTLCHGDYVNKNILFEDDKLWVIDFDNCCYNYLSQDISYFLRRLLKRNSTRWDIQTAKDVISTYNDINPLNCDDAKYILAYLCFPQKYWRISKDYYSSTKKFSNSWYIESMENIVDKTENQLEFASELEYFMISKFL